VRDRDWRVERDGLERSAMGKIIHAVYENGVFRPIERVDLPERCEVEFQIRQVKTDPLKPALDDVYAILGRRHSTGEPDLAKRHNEHQP
jgi:predicted DNA-binding antitoxin AbrB/MazE fold protein